MDLKEKDFVNCKYNPLKSSFLKDCSQLVHYMDNYIPFEFKGDREKLLKYVVLLYDPGSPLIKGIADAEIRKKEAAELAGYDIHFTDVDFLETLYNLDELFAVEIIDYYIKTEIRVRLWYLIQGNEQTFYEYGKRLLLPVKWNIKEKDMISSIAIKTKLSEDMAAINERLENDYNKLYADDTALIKIVTTKKFSPEGQSTRIK